MARLVPVNVKIVAAFPVSVRLPFVEYASVRELEPVEENAPADNVYVPSDKIPRVSVTVLVDAVVRFPDSDTVDPVVLTVTSQESETPAEVTVTLPTAPVNVSVPVWVHDTLFVRVNAGPATVSTPVPSTVIALAGSIPETIS